MNIAAGQGGFRTMFDRRAGSPTQGRRVRSTKKCKAYLITPREAQVLVLVAEGMSGKEIADRLCLAIRTVDQHIIHLKLKTKARNRTHMVTISFMNGLIEMEGA